jgi:DNA-binding CsgD family transcriptional regulator
MTEQAKSTEQLHTEIVNLRKQNKELAAQLAFHRKVFREVNIVLGVAGELNKNITKDGAVQKLVEENERLKNQLKIFRLSEREKEILKLIVHGYTSKEIADRLNLSKLTVDTHRKNIQHKLDVSNVAELIKLAILSDVT